MKPRVRKFRIGASASGRADRQDGATAEAEKDAPSRDVGDEAATGPVDHADEQLSARHLRLARRTAQRHGLSPVSDHDAVRMLRKRGIDPFQRATIVELVAKTGAAREVSQTDARPQLPQMMSEAGRSPPSTELSPADRRAREITGIQRDIAKRRRRKLALLIPSRVKADSRRGFPRR